jgi:hypothetical protein
MLGAASSVMRIATAGHRSRDPPAAFVGERPRFAEPPAAPNQARKEAHDPADRKMDVTGTDTNTITGAHSGTYKAGRTQTVSGQDDVLNVALNRTSTITGQYHIQADAEYKVTHKSNVILLSGIKAEVTNGKCKITMDGGKLMVEAPESLTITSIALTTSECTTKGATINVDGGNGGGRVALDAVGATVTGKTKASLGSNATTEISGSVVRIN